MFTNGTTRFAIGAEKFVTAAFGDVMTVMTVAVTKLRSCV